jgi:methanogenic corrinoid protein MtbC1
MVLAEIARARSDDEAAGDMDRLEALVAASVGPSTDAVAALIRDWLKAGVAPETILDRHIPAAARALGEAWVRDTQSFVSVTVGTARLQTAARLIGEELCGSLGEAPDARSALIVVPVGEDHTLGAVLAAQRVRRAGHLATVLLQSGPDELASYAREGGIDVVFVSASSGSRTDAARATVKTLKAVLPGGTPVIAAGSRAADPAWQWVDAGFDAVARSFEDAVDIVNALLPQRLDRTVNTG